MKLTISDLENARSTPEVSTGNSASGGYRKVVPERPFSVSEVTFNGNQEIATPTDELQRVSAMGWDIEKELNVALKRRLDGVRALSVREADIVARGKIDIAHDSSMEYALMEMGCMFTEGVPGHEDSGYELRRRYNHGLKWMENGEARGFLPGMKEKGIERLAEIRDKLVEISLDLWPYEVNSGFHADLIRPEWMTHAQYNKCRKFPVRIVEATDVNVG